MMRGTRADSPGEWEEFLLSLRDQENIEVGNKARS
jgi:hypothetical protein